MSTRPVEATWICPRFEYSRYAVFVCSVQSEMVNCRLFWQFSGLVGGVGVLSGSSKVARCVEAVCGTQLCVPTSWRLSERLPRYGWRLPSLYGVLPNPLIEPGFCELLALWMNPLTIWLLLFSFFPPFFSACLFWRGMNSPYCTMLAGSASRPTNLYFCYCGQKVHLTSAMISHRDVYSNQRSWIC
jgi:hypothetical protein